jgi:hypothetical protein
MQHGRLIIGIALLINSLAGQTSAAGSDWADVIAIKAGSRVRVTRDDAPQEQGTFRSASFATIVIRLGSRDVPVARDHVVEVSAAQGASRKRHALIGFFLGLLTGGIVNVIECHGQGEGCLEGSPPSTWLFSGIGALVGMSLPTAPWKVVYTRPAGG